MWSPFVPTFGFLIDSSRMVSTEINKLKRSNMKDTINYVLIILFRPSYHRLLDILRHEDERELAERGDSGI